MNTTRYLFLCMFHIWQLCGMEPNAVHKPNDHMKKKKPAHIPSLVQLCAKELAKELLDTKLEYAEMKLTPEQLCKVLPNNDYNLKDAINSNLTVLALNNTPKRGVVDEYAKKHHLKLMGSIDTFCWFQSPHYSDDYSYTIFDTQKKGARTIFKNRQYLRQLHLYRSPTLCSVGIKYDTITFVTLSEDKEINYPIKAVSNSFPYVASFPSSIIELALCGNNHLIVRHSNGNHNGYSDINVYALHTNKNKKTIAAQLCFSQQFPDINKIVALKNNSFLISCENPIRNTSEYSIIDCRTGKIIKKWKPKEINPLYSTNPAWDVDQAKQLIAFYDEKNNVQISSLRSNPDRQGFLPALALLKHKGPAQSIRFLPNSNYVMISTERYTKPDAIYIWYWPTHSRVFKFTMPSNPGNPDHSCTYVFTTNNQAYLSREWGHAPLYTLDLSKLPVAEEIKKAINPCYNHETLLYKLDAIFYSPYFAYVKNKPISPKASAFAISHAPALPYAALQNTKDQLD